ncbi:hypothetical protein HCR18_06835 [Wolbachia pipientis]|uniref:hypothetical protein n=1 Tax=Wolbachia pipientis TaxID=955 RepID=UPI001C713C40|nr:hypothetical protein [Wolbachia pipientis]MBA8758693.1 hypothetical protein [Wolbachia pipientis]
MKAHSSLSFQHLTLESSFPSKTVSSQCLTLGSSFLYKFTKSVSFYNAKPILTKPNALLAIKFPGSQCQALG